MNSIYGLVDPRVGSVRYVGKTSMSLEKRLGFHVAQANRWLNGKRSRVSVFCWIAKLLREDVRPEIRLLQECDDFVVDAFEKEWIATLRMRPNITLLNGTDGGDGGRQSPEVRAKMSASHIALWQDPDYRARRAAGPADRSYQKSEEGRSRSRESTTQLWLNPRIPCKGCIGSDWTTQDSL